MDKLRRALTGNELSDDGDEERGIITQVMDSSTLSWSTRIKGFVICFVLGFLLTILASSLMFLPGIGLGIFAVFYTIGNILALSSTCFLMGPMKQLQKMFAPTRLIASIIMILALLMTLVAVFVLGNKMLAIILVVIQFLAMTWYALSYIPYARNAATKCFTSCVGV